MISDLDDMSEDSANHTGELVAMFSPLMLDRIRKRTKRTRGTGITECAVSHLERMLEQHTPSFFRAHVDEPVVEASPVKPLKIKARGHRRRHKRHTRSTKRK
jgi:hypothetical protein